MQPERLIFVYNARSGKLNGLLDLLHKNISPRTYPCQLCAVTYNNSGMLPEWKQFIEQLGVEVVFLHKDEWAKYPGTMTAALPAAFLIQQGKTSVCIPATEMRQVADVKALIDLTRIKLQHAH